MGRVITWAAVGVLAAIVLAAGAAAGVVSTVLGTSGHDVCAPAAATANTTSAAPEPAPEGLTADQTQSATIIVQVGQKMKVPVRGRVIAIATALQESNLINLGDLGSDNDHDSLGLFQQRPSQGWGTPEQIMNPQYAASKFYKALLRVPGWQNMPVTQAAQRVQRSAFPDAYAKHEERATAIVTAFTGGTLPDCGPVEVSAYGWTRPVPGTIVSGFRTPERPRHDGIDIAAPRNTVIRAAAAGLVVTVLCNVSAQSYPPTGGTLPCDSDGYPGLGGCGWYVQIRHTDAVSRYCHMVEQPAVRVGQTVTAGQPIGLVGTSGNSSGEHLHLEIHTGYPAHESNAISPTPFLADRGVHW